MKKPVYTGGFSPFFDQSERSNSATHLLRPVSTSMNLVARPSDGLGGHAQLEIQAESERSLTNARPVLEVKSRSIFSRPE